MSNYKIGTTVPGLQDLDTLGLPDPFPVEFTRFDETYAAGDGSEVGDGFSNFSWHFDMLTMAQWDTIMDYLGSAQSVQLFITTTTDVGDSYANLFSTFQAWMKRPQARRAFGRQYMRDITLEFVSAEEQT